MDKRLEGTLQMLRFRLVEMIGQLDKDMDYIERLKLKPKKEKK